MGSCILNVAEKNSIAKEISKFLSHGDFLKIQSASKYNPTFKFGYKISNRPHDMIFTSVSGHLFNLDFPSWTKSWNMATNSDLFDIPVEVMVSSNNKNIALNLSNFAAVCNKLIIWTDCDREGEYIGHSIAKVCKRKNFNIQVLRARFSDVSMRSVTHAIENLVLINEYQVNAVNCRMEADLRLGAVFTRAQSLNLRDDKSNIISYGPCQFPTLGLVVKRYDEIVNFKSEAFYYLEAKVKHPCGLVKFNWDRNHLFDQAACKALYEVCNETQLAVVEKVKKKDVTKHRPMPMDTVAMEKLASNHLHISAKQTMEIAEGLYNRGFISYPRTETTQFSTDINFQSLVTTQKSSPVWGAYANNLLNDNMIPSRGNKNDNAHPPIHPIKCGNELNGLENKLYEIIVRHFLACLSKDAKGIETSVTIAVDSEKFHAKGLVIVERNFLDIYPYIKWAESVIPLFEEGSTFKANISMNEGATEPPLLLTESDLISLMVLYGIGTDATHADHIDKITKRDYAIKNGKFYMPTLLGYSLIKGYESMGLDSMFSPMLRASFEKRLEKIVNGSDNSSEVLSDIIGKYKGMYQVFTENINGLKNIVMDYRCGNRTLSNIIAKSRAQAATKCGLCGVTGHTRRNCPTNS